MALDENDLDEIEARVRKVVQDENFRFFREAMAKYRKGHNRAFHKKLEALEAELKEKLLQEPLEPAQPVEPEPPKPTIRFRPYTHRPK